MALEMGPTNHVFLGLAWACSLLVPCSWACPGLALGLFWTGLGLLWAAVGLVWTWFGLALDWLGGVSGNTLKEKPYV